MLVVGTVCHYPKEAVRPAVEGITLGHVGICCMKALARSFIWWPGLDTDIKKEATHCDTCKMTAAMPAMAP